MAILKARTKAQNNNYQGVDLEDGIVVDRAGKDVDGGKISQGLEQG